MVADLSRSMAGEASVMMAESANRDFPGKKIAMKVPKKIHKAEREKLKRDQLNDLFTELGNSLERSNRQNSGKASILCDATQLLHDLLVQVESLKKEKSALLMESNYVTIEKNELEDETSLLRSEVEKLRNDVKERMQSVPTWSNQANIPVTQAQLPNSCPQDPPPSLDPTLQPSPVVGPLFMFPICPDHQEHHNSDKTPSFPCSVVRKPHPRYPTRTDSWPLQLLSKLSGDKEGEQTVNPSISVSQNVESGHDLGS